MDALFLRAHAVAMDAICAALSGRHAHDYTASSPEPLVDRVNPSRVFHYLCQACGCTWDYVRQVECPSCQRACSVCVLPSDDYDASLTDPRR